MATIVLAAAGAAIGGGFSGVAALGLSGAAIGQAVGALGGQAVDGLLFSGSSATQRVTGPRLQSLEVMTSNEGAPLVYPEGRVRVSGEVIWATRLEEVQNTSTQSVGGGKGGGGKVETTEFAYFANLAVAVCDGPIQHFGRVWADGEPLDLAGLEVRFYRGFEGQEPDPLLEAKEGGDAPAYRGTAYVVFERLPLAEFGNRVPQLSFEVFGPPGEMEKLVRGVDLIPGSTEWGYMPEVVTNVTSRTAGGEVAAEEPENNHRHADVTDWELSMDALGQLLPNASTVALVVAWFGTDLRAGLCEIHPGVELAEKDTEPHAWSVAGLDRASAPVVSQVDGRPAFGSTPADVSVVRAIQDLKARGHRVVLYPFIMMDIPEGAGLPDPWGGAEQPAYPWRGRIRPRPAQPVAAEVAAFAGTAAASDFAVAGEAVTYAGPSEWGFRRFILHLAHLAKAAGGVDAFLVGSEMVSMTTATDTAGAYPFVDVLVDLAAEVSGVIPAALVSYAADWSEYHSHRDGGEVFFHLDPLWSSEHVDFVGIDNYLPLADWREGTDHLDYDPDAGHTSQYSLAYLKSNVEGGEYWDFYYASESDRWNQVRTPIADLAHGEDWVFRQKAIVDWRDNAHRNRPGGVRDASPTAWVPGSKPVWFTELGAPAVDKAANQPNVFWSAHSSEGAIPHFSSGARDDFAQRQFLRAALEYWRDRPGGVSPDDVLVWAWDARPWPEFPNQDSVWADGPDWTLGHWLNGRACVAPAAEAIQRRLALHGFPAGDLDLERCHGQVDGYAAADAMGFREWFQPLELVLRLDAFEDFGKLVFQARESAVPQGVVTVGQMVDREGASRFQAVRAALSEIPDTAVLRFMNGVRDYEPTAARVGLEEGREEGMSVAEVPLVLDPGLGKAALERWLRAASGGRETRAFELPPSAFDVRPGTLLEVELPDDDRLTFVVDQVTEGEARAVVASSFDRGAFRRGRVVRQAGRVIVAPRSRLLLLEFLDLPLLADQSADDGRGFIALHAEPWPGGADVYRSAEEATGYALNVQVGLRATMGETVSALAPGRLGVWSPETVDVRLYSGELVGRPSRDVLDGANGLAIRHASGEWEVIQFRGAELVDASTWRLSGLLRGQRGTEAARAASALPAGAAVVALDAAVVPVELAAHNLGNASWWKWGPTREDPSDKVFRSASHTFRGVGRRPFAPVHLRAGWDGADLSLGWVRRTRIEGDRWDVRNPPRGEADRLFRVEVGPEGTPVHVAEVSATAWTYAAADQSADGLSGPVEVRVSQVSDTWGPGTPARITVNL